jgi:hypothetical protein
MWKWWFRKKTREQMIDCRVDSVFILLTSDVEFQFTELETLQILNKVRTKLKENLSNKRASIKEQTQLNHKRISEIDNVLTYIE